MFIDYMHTKLDFRNEFNKISRSLNSIAQFIDNCCGFAMQRDLVGLLLIIDFNHNLSISQA